MFWTNFVIIDCEYTDWKMSSPAKTIPSIIEVGLLRCTAEGQIVGQYETLIQPIQPETMSDKIHMITGINREELKIAPQWLDVYKDIFNFIAGDCLLSWGGVDSWLLRKQCEFTGLDFYPRVCYDIQSILAERYWKSTGQVLSNSLSKACAQVGVKEGKHRALEDCKAVHRLMSYISGQKVEKKVEKFEIFEL